MSVDTDSAPLDAEKSASGSGGYPFPVDGYEALTVAQVLPRLESLSVCQLHQVADFERRHANRRLVLDAIERALG